MKTEITYSQLITKSAVSGIMLGIVSEFFQEPLVDVLCVIAACGMIYKLVDMTRSYKEENTLILGSSFAMIFSVLIPKVLHFGYLTFYK